MHRWEMEIQDEDTWRADSHVVSLNIDEKKTVSKWRLKSKNP